MDRCPPLRGVVVVLPLLPSLLTQKNSTSCSPTICLSA
nr:MAG TPA: hypothetical protein [Caudoviricetes sp.]